MLTGDKSLPVLTVSGTDSSNNPFTGKITIRFFENIAPETIANIKTLVNAGYYNNGFFSSHYWRVHDSGRIVKRR
ncbi:MAG: peptidylprolyl isomerase [Gemmataceae bacterium]